MILPASLQRVLPKFRPGRGPATALPLAVLVLALAGCGGGDSPESGAVGTRDAANPGQSTSRTEAPVASRSIPVPAAGSETVPPADSLHARARLVSETHFLVPGETHVLGVLFETDPGWHIYGNARNDTGMPPNIQLNLPRGFTAGEIQWPTPERHVSPGNILDHVYTGKVAFLVPVDVPADLAPGSFVTLTGKADWLVCSDVCLAEAGSLELTLPVAMTRQEAIDLLADADLPPLPPTARGDGQILALSRMRVPEPLPGEMPTLTRRWEGNTLHLGMENAAGMVFHPGRDCPALENPIADAAVEGGALSLAFRERPSADRPVTGILELRFPPAINVPNRYYSISIPGPA